MKVVPKLRQEVNVKVDIVTSDDIKIYYTGKFQDYTARYIINRGYLFFSVKNRNLFHRVDIIGNIFTSGAARSENITDSFHEMKINFDLSPKKKSVYFMLLTLSGRSFIKSRTVLFHYSPWRTPSG